MMAKQNTNDDLTPLYPMTCPCTKGHWRNRCMGVAYQSRQWAGGGGGQPQCRGSSGSQRDS